MERILNKTVKTIKTLSKIVLLGSVIFAINTSVSFAGSFRDHADQISWVLPTNAVSAISHADVITWKCCTGNVTVASHKDEISWTSNIQWAQN